ncbi:copper-binding protein [Alteromonas sp. V450]|uniref:copper resistance D family protein n=1 Tax=Alteromonas sp. V450 TaxID=1912139 RepID=UPI0008FF1C3C|nr:CopD family protein [Alteromonas sp. V450]OJF68973.1 copper-binding protein [Alteromonas sp. V450]
MEMYIWSTLIVLSNFSFYLGFVSIASYTFLGQVIDQIQQKAQQKTTTTPSTFLKLINGWIFVGLVANFIWFIASTGAMAEDGIRGALDSDMIELMWGSSIGEVTFYRSIGFSIAIFAFVFFVYSKPTKIKRYVLHLLYLCSLLLLAYSFSVLGHVSELAWLERITLIFHVLLIAWWMGALLPLRYACSVLAHNELFILMEKFGKQAVPMVTLIIIAGLWLSIQLVGSIDALVTTSYGQVLLFKLILVNLILLLAARHKFKLVPALNNSTGREMLSKSISIEIVIALAILVTTSALTSLVGPESYL